MKFLMTYTPATIEPPTPEKMAAIAKFGEDMMKSGVLVMTGGLQRPAAGTHLQLAEGKFAVTDGPYAETKELIDGFALVQVKSKEEALEVAKRFLIIAGDGKSEIVQVFDAADIPDR
jgi:hypothetical protein